MARKFEDKVCGVCGTDLTIKKGYCRKCKAIPTKYEKKTFTPPTPEEKMGLTPLWQATQDQLKHYLSVAKDFRDKDYCPVCNPVESRLRNKIEIPVKGKRQLDRMTKEEIADYLKEKYAVTIKNATFTDVFQKANQLNYRFHPDS